jgi:Ca-activated chloride channel family protein
MNPIVLQQPEWLWLSIAIVPAYMAYRRGYLRTASVNATALSVKHPLTAVLPGQSAQPAQNRVQAGLTGIFILLVLLSLSQPARLGDRLPAPPQPVDLMLIIDTSISMVLQDYRIDEKPVDRMTMTKVLLDRFIRRYEGKRIGIVVLGEQPHILLQPSEDHNLARHMIHRLRTSIVGRHAALGDAIAVAAEQIEHNTDTLETVMVLISDAVLPQGKLSPIEGARRAAAAGATLHTIAIGSSVMQIDAQQSLIFEPADVELLSQLAELTGGKSFHAVDTQAMDKALISIEGDHRQTTTMTSPQLKEPLYIWPLGASIVLLIVMTLLPYLESYHHDHE